MYYNCNIASKGTFKLCIYKLLLLTEMNAEEAVSMSPRLLAKELNITNAQSFEKRIRRELEAQGRCLSVCYYLCHQSLSIISILELMKNYHCNSL